MTEQDVRISMLKLRALNRENPTFRQLEKASEELLFHFLNQKSINLEIKNLQAEALNEVIIRMSNPPLANNPLQAGNKIVIVGNSQFKKRALSKRLKALDIELQSKIQSTTSHLLVGKKLKCTSQELKQKTLLKDEDLQYFLEQTEKPYLLEEANDAQNTQHIADLLFSDEVENQNIGLTLLQVGGLNPNFIPYAFVVIKTTANTKLRKALRNLIQLKLSPEGIKSLNRNFSLKEEIDESKIQKNIEKCTKNTSDLDGLEIARILYHYQKQGFSYIWKYSKDQDEIKQTIKDHLVDNKLDFFDAGITFLPEELALLPQIEVVDLAGNYDLSKIPPVLAKLPNMHTLDLSFTYIFNYGKTLIQCKKLKKLTLDGLPILLDVLGNLENLKELIVDPNQQMIDKEGRNISPKKQKSRLQQILPNCNISWVWE